LTATEIEAKLQKIPNDWSHIAGAVGNALDYVSNSALSNYVHKSDLEFYSTSNAVQLAIQAAVNEASQNILNSVFPIGYILTTFDNRDYSDYLGFSWESITDTFLYADGKYTLGETGGEETHTLSSNEMPKHTHGEYLNCNFGGGTRTVAGEFIIESATYVNWSAAARNNINFGYAGPTGQTGDSQAHNNMPPFTAVRMWRRIS
jgi:hypothetical protein